MTFQPRVIAGMEVDAREAKKAARRRYGGWCKAVKSYMAAGTEPKLLRGDVLLAVELTNFPSADFGYCYIGQKSLAGRLGASRRTAQRAMARLKAAGFLICARGGQGRTSRWTFAVEANPLFSLKDDAARGDTDGAARSAKMTPQDASRMTPQEATRMAHNPCRTETLEQKPFEQQPQEPTPPPLSVPRAREARALTEDVLAGLTIDQRKDHRWKGLTRWIDAQLGQGAEPIDIAAGITQALQSLKGEAPSSFGYFVKPIERARASRLRPLPSGSPAPVPSLHSFTSYVARELGMRPAALVDTIIAADLATLHQKFTAKAIGFNDVLTAIRAALPEGGAR